MWLTEEKVTQILKTLQEEYPEENDHTINLHSFIEHNNTKTTLTDNKIINIFHNELQ